AESKQRRNRRSPRHLRASGQRRRRGRDRRPNPFRLRKGGVASPEMAMGKVMPRYIPKPAPKKEERVKEEAAVVATAVPAIQGGFACPEMAMGKVIIRREQPAVVETPVVEPKVQQPVETKVEAPVVEAPVVEAPIAAAPVAEPAMVEQAETTTEAAQEPVVEVVEDTVEQVAVEAPIAAPAPKAEVIKVAAKPRASAPMTKAPGPQELREITVSAAPFKAERYAPKGAGSQVATNRASSGMTKPNFN
ncbi:ribonuclease E, partial [Vibrio rotiferianus]